MHQSIATIDSPEFINLQPLDINPLMSSCDIKVLYVGQNRNHSYITKEVATNMAKTLRGAPIVGYYKEEKGDFADHGEKVIIDDEGIKFQCMTVPYGFVSPDAKVWFQTFNDIDDFGNEIKREYLVTTGYLWTGQYEECKKALDGRPHSMELDNDSLEGKWSTDSSTGMDFFIVNDATFSKLCILGDDVEPCFEGSSITSPATTFSKVDNSFKHTLFSMMEDLKFALKGGNEQVTQEATVDTSIENLDNSNELTPVENEVQTEEVVDTSAQTEFEKSDKDEKDKENSDEKKDQTQENKSDEDKSNDEENKTKEDKEKYSLLKTQYDNLQSSFDNLQSKYNDLEKTVKVYEKEKKEALINKFYMLDEEDKQDVKDNIDKYSLDDIESKLSVICVRKKVSFSDEEKDLQPNTTFSLDSLDNNEDNTPDWIKAVWDYKNNRE